MRQQHQPHLFIFFSLLRCCISSLALSLGGSLCFVCSFPPLSPPTKKRNTDQHYRKLHDRSTSTRLERICKLEQSPDVLFHHDTSEDLPELVVSSTPTTSASSVLKRRKKRVQWSKRFQELEQYCQRHGNCNVPQRYQTNSSLGKWVSNQRTQYKLYQRGGKSCSLTKERVEAMDDLGFVWAIPGKRRRRPLHSSCSWVDMLEELRQYKAEYGNSAVPVAYETKNNKQLGRWVTIQRKQYKLYQQGKVSALTKERIEVLNSLKFLWDGRKLRGRTRNDDKWFSKLNDLRDYISQHGHCIVSTNDKDNKSLAVWIYNQRKQYRLYLDEKPSSLTKARIEALDEAGFVYDVSHRKHDNQEWLTMLSDLIKYKEQYGKNGNVPISFHKNKALNDWVCGIRRQYRLYQQGKRSRLSKERIEVLNFIGFKWDMNGQQHGRKYDDVDERVWQAKFQELKKFTDLHRHCTIPARDAEYRSLASFVHNQRTQFKLYKRGKLSSLTKERIELLQGVGCMLDIPSRKRNDTRKWLVKLEELREYKIGHGDCAVPQHYAMNKSLGIWVNNQRAQYRRYQQGKPSLLSEEQIDVLEFLGFVFDARNHKKPGKNDGKWLEKLEELRRFKARNGHVQVPLSAKTEAREKSLAVWVNNQRSQYKLFQRKKPSQLTHKRIKALQSIGFVWTVKHRHKPRRNEEKFHAKLEELRRYKDENGHCQVPTKNLATKPLGTFVNNQRAQYKLYNRGEVSTLTKQRIESLNRLGFVWECKT